MSFERAQALGQQLVEIMDVLAEQTDYYMAAEFLTTLARLELIGDGPLVVEAKAAREEHRAELGEFAWKALDPIELSTGFEGDQVDFWIREAFELSILVPWLPEQHREEALKAVAACQKLVSTSDLAKEAARCLVADREEHEAPDKLGGAAWLFFQFLKEQ